MSSEVLKSLLNFLKVCSSILRACQHFEVNHGHSRTLTFLHCFLASPCFFFPFLSLYFGSLNLRILIFTLRTVSSLWIWFPSFVQRPSSVSPCIVTVVLVHTKRVCSNMICWKKITKITKLLSTCSKVHTLLLSLRCFNSWPAKGQCNAQIPYFVWFSPRHLTEKSCPRNVQIEVIFVGVAV